MNVITVPYSRDNFGYIVRFGARSFIIDPGEGPPFEPHITKPPSAILLTHEHWDHVNGVPHILHLYPKTPVFIKDPSLIKHICAARPTSELASMFPTPPKILPTPGHSLGSVCFYFEQGAAFVGDVLFAMGCGGVFTQDYEAAFASIQTVKALPPETILYWGHNYAKINYIFARSVLKNTQSLRAYADKMHTQGTGALLEDELRFNPFLQAETVQEFQNLRFKKIGVSA